MHSYTPNVMANMVPGRIFNLLLQLVSIADEPSEFCQKVYNHLESCKGINPDLGNTCYRNMKRVIRCIREGHLPDLESLQPLGLVKTVRRGELADVRLALSSEQSDYSDENDDVFVELPREAQHAALGHDDSITMSILWFPEGQFPVYEANSSLLNGHVMSIELGKEISGLTNKVNITFSHQNASLENATCVFWDRRKDNGGTRVFWNSSGCTTEQDYGKVVCHCDHLSFFAILLSPVYKTEAPVMGNGTQNGTLASTALSAYSIWLLTLLSQIGCGVSVCFLVIVLIYHAVYRRNNSEDTLSIHIHLCVALLGLNLSFLINKSLTDLNIHELCVFIAAVTHYTLLCTLTWFAIEGFHLYLLVVRVFNIYVNRYLLKLALVGWGLPAVPVISIIGASKYGRFNIYSLEGGAETICYVPESVLNSLTFAYFVLVLVVNLLVWIAVTVQVVRARKLSPAQQERRLSRRDVFSLLGVSCLLGLSWGVMVFWFDSVKEGAFYIFCTVNSLHGFFVCLRYFTLYSRPKKSLEGKTMTATASTTTASTVTTGMDTRISFTHTEM